MNTNMTAEQKMLKDSAREFFSKEIDSTWVRAAEAPDAKHDKAIWKKMADMGWLGMLIPEQFGGEEMEFIDMVLLLEEMGSAAYTGPYFATALLAAGAILAGGTDAQKKKLLPKIAGGKMLMTLAVHEPGLDTAYEITKTEAVSIDDGYRLSGTKTFVPYGNIADKIIVAARVSDGKVHFFAVDRKSAGIDIRVMDTLVGDKLCEVVFTDTPVAKDDRLGDMDTEGEGFKQLMRMAAVGKCAETVGGGRKVLRMTVDYAKKRMQFGQPIGSFQAVQHHCANILTFLDTSMLITYMAAWRIGNGLPCEKEASMCKAYVSDAGHRMTLLGHQVMGGFGFMEETDHQLYFRRAKAAAFAFGNTPYHQGIVADSLGLQ
jgi:alkylation response protein AidB-like acyl-CoA dehydrogenase